MKRPIIIPNWEQEASKLLSGTCGPRMIVVDLDFTLWPTFFSEHTLPPYICLDDISGGKPSTVLCVDRMTKKPRTLSLYEEVRRAIEWCVEQGFELSICSKSSSFEGAEMILTALGLWDIFKFPQVYHARKTFHFRNLRSCTNFCYSDFLFFDDDSKNIEVCSSIGVNCCLVDKATGFCGETLLAGLRQFVHQKSCTPRNAPSPWTTIPSKKLKTDADTDVQESPFSFQWTASA